MLSLPALLESQIIKQEADATLEREYWSKHRNERRWISILWKEVTGYEPGEIKASGKIVSAPVSRRFRQPGNCCDSRKET